MSERKVPRKTLTPRRRAEEAVARRDRYRTCSTEARAVAARLESRLYGPDSHAFYENLISTTGHAAKHMATSGTELLDDMLSGRVGTGARDRDHVNGFESEESAEYDIVDGLVLAKYEIAAWLCGEHEVPATRRLELYIPDVNRREDLDDPDCVSLAGPAFARTSDDICRAESAGMWLILDPRDYDRESFDVVTAYPDVVPGVSRNVPADLTTEVRATGYYQRQDEFGKAVLEYMAADKPPDRPVGYLSRQQSASAFMLPVDDPPGARLAVERDGTIRLVPSRADRDGGARRRVLDASDPATRAAFPAAMDVAAGIQRRVDELSGFVRRPSPATRASRPRPGTRPGGETARAVAAAAEISRAAAARPLEEGATYS